MTRSTLRLDRVLTALVGFVVLAGGVALVLWWARGVGSGSGTLAVPGASGVADAAWWPWLLAVLGLALVIAALAWLAAHLHRVGIRSVSLPDSGDDGRLRLRLDALAHAAAASAERRIATESASGEVGSGVDAGVVEVTVTARHDTTLDELRRDLRAVDEEVALATDGAVPVRYRVRVARPPRSAVTR